MIVDAHLFMQKINENSQKEKRMLSGENEKDFYDFNDLRNSEKNKNMVE